MKRLKVLQKDAKIRASNKDVNAMKAMKVTMKAMKRRVSRPELHKKALIKDIKLLLLKINTEGKARKAQSLATQIFGVLRLNEPHRAKMFRSVLEVLENEVNEFWKVCFSPVLESVKNNKCQ